MRNTLFSNQVKELYQEKYARVLDSPVLGIGLDCFLESIDCSEFATSLVDQTMTMNDRIHNRMNSEYINGG
jgi:hypothetical protein